MIFNSWSYLLLLGMAVPIFYSLPQKLRIVFSLLISMGFYAMWRWDFAFLMLFSSVVDYVAAQKIDQTSNKRQRFSWLMLSLCINLGLLVFFKYTYFLDDNVRGVLHLLGYDYPGLKASGFQIILPLGISFYTFQTISYTIDVYRGIIKPTRNFFLFAAYVTFWPQLIAGPVLRAKEVIPQFLKKPVLDLNNINFGITKIIIGLFKKVVLADNIAPLVDDVFAMDPSYLSAYDVWLGTILFGFQIYFDFSGYSDIAIGSARLMGFKFPENFNWPYLAKSPREFWQRWHITLSSWIRDYLYLPLMGEKFQTTSQGGIDIEKKDVKKKESRRNFALFGTWLIMGFWHGAGWNFALWGLFHALMIYTYRSIGILRKLPKQFPIFSTLFTFFIMMMGWIPFRAVDLTQSLHMFSIILNPFEYNIFDRQLPFSSYAFAGMIVAGMLGAAFTKQLFERFEGSIVLNLLPKYLGLSVLTFFIIVYIQTVVQFIYFQF